ncbi:unnamed protein product [Rhizophagus irregularis]|nr:unnamed protein product [Rhizophagus irregularis]
MCKINYLDVNTKFLDLAHIYWNTSFGHLNSSFWTWKVSAPWVKGMKSYKRYYYLSFILDRNLILVLSTPLPSIDPYRLIFFKLNQTE